MISSSALKIEGKNEKMNTFMKQPSSTAFRYYALPEHEDIVLRSVCVLVSAGSSFDYHLLPTDHYDPERYNSYLNCPCYSMIMALLWANERLKLT
jgi:hypothetical protein